MVHMVRLKRIGCRKLNRIQEGNSFSKHMHQFGNQRLILYHAFYTVSSCDLLCREKNPSKRRHRSETWSSRPEGLNSERLDPRTNSKFERFSFYMVHMVRLKRVGCRKLSRIQGAIDFPYTCISLVTKGYSVSRFLHCSCQRTHLPT